MESRISPDLKPFMGGNASHYFGDVKPFIARDTSQYFPGIGPHTPAPLPKLNWAQRQARRVSDAVGGFWDRLVFVVKGGDIYDRD